MIAGLRHQGAGSEPTNIDATAATEQRSARVGCWVLRSHHRSLEATQSSNAMVLSAMLAWDAATYCIVMFALLHSHVARTVGKRLTKWVRDKQISDSACRRQRHR